MKLCGSLSFVALQLLNLINNVYLLIFPICHLTHKCDTQ